MPIYEYRCNECGGVSEILVGLHAEGETLACQHCGGSDLEKILSVSSFTFTESTRAPGKTCCGKDERCDSPPCLSGGGCGRDR